MKRFRTLLICFLLLAMLAGCTKAPAVTQESSTQPTVQPTIPQEHEFTEVYQRYQAPCSAGFVLRGNVLQTTVGENTYEFDASLSEETCKTFIEAQELLCAHLKAFGIPISGITFRILPEYSNRSESENAIAYIASSTVTTWQQVLTTLQAVLGDFVNYGYVYALSEHVCTALGWQADKATELEPDRFSRQPSLLNLVYPCFAEDYTKKRDIDSCKALSLTILDQMDDPYAGETLFLQKRDTYAAAMRIDFTPTELGFAYNGEDCPLKLRTKYVEILKDSTFVSDYWYQWGFYEEDFLAELDTMIQTFQWLDTQLQELCTTFGIDPPLLRVQLSDNAPENGYYDTNLEPPLVQTSSCTIIFELFVLYLADQLGIMEAPGYEDWNVHALMAYYSLEAAYEWRCLVYSNSLDYLEEFIGQPYDEPSDELLVTHWTLLASDKKPAFWLKTDFSAGSLFGDYFVQNYGEDAFRACMLAPSKTQEITGVSLDQIVDDWCEYIMIPPKATEKPDYM